MDVLSERFDAVATLAQDMGLAVQRRSDNAALAADTSLWLGDSMGELFAYYGCADVAFVGGSLLPLGVVLDTPAHVAALAPRIKAMAVDAQVMPLGNTTGMTPAERAKLGAWIAQGAKP